MRPSARRSCARDSCAWHAAQRRSPCCTRRPTWGPPRPAVVSGSGPGSELWQVPQGATVGRPATSSSPMTSPSSTRGVTISVSNRPGGCTRRTPSCCAPEAEHALSQQARVHQSFLSFTPRTRARSVPGVRAARGADARWAFCAAFAHNLPVHPLRSPMPPTQSRRDCLAEEPVTQGLRAPSRLPARQAAGLIEK